MSAATSKKCPHCNGPVEVVGNGRRGPIERCRACGREPGEIVKHQATDGRIVPTSAARVSKTCTVEGCPGTPDDAGHCACCARRAAFIEQRAPKRKCTICEGFIAGHGGRQVCDACKAAAKRAKVVLKPRRGKAA